MASMNLKLIFLVALFAASSGFKVEARPLTSTAYNLRARLKLEQESSNCWDSLIQLQSCTTEIILFFVNGETHLGDGCCQAIHIISGNCWPNLMETLGYTAEEGDILEGYCIKDTDDSPPRSPPSPAHVVPNHEVVRGQFLAP
ncbi:Egg cell-secreted protein 1.1 [Euphorbia peplus]|nr:Egg cell-secreted protein 1.1 [Euphorbia peplus]